MTDPNAQLALQVRHDLQRMATEFEAVLPPQIPTDRFVRTAITAVGMQPDLLRTDRRSLLGACMKAAQDGLLPDGREAALVVPSSPMARATNPAPMAALPTHRRRCRD